MKTKKEMYGHSSLFQLSKFKFSLLVLACIMSIDLHKPCVVQQRRKTKAREGDLQQSLPVVAIQSTTTQSLRLMEAMYITDKDECRFSYINIMGGASHGSSCPVRTCPFDLITSHHFAYIFHFFSVTCLVVCNMCNGQ